MLNRLQRDIQSIKERDPAATGLLDILLNYPGLHAIWVHRLTHKLYKRGNKTLARLLSQIARFFTQVEIHPGAVIGEGLFIDHGCGIVIGETTIIGDNVTIYQGVTLGGTGKETGKRHPTIGDDVMISSGAKILGNITIGSNVKIGAGSVVLKHVPSNATVVGIPGRVVRQDGQKVQNLITELDHGHLPDPIGDSLYELRKKIKSLEMRLAKYENEKRDVEGEHANETQSV